MSHSIKGNLLLLLTAMIWGAAFVAQSVGMDYVEPFAFQAARSLLGCLTLLPAIAVLDRKKGPPSRTHTPQERRVLWRGGILCGLLLFAASNLQQFGLCYTSAGKAGFITAMYIVLVPIAGLFFRRRAGATVWVGVLLAACGLYLLCVTDGFSIGMGDILVFLCSIVFTAHILVIDHFSPHVDGVRMSCIQFFVTAVLSAVCSLIFESTTIDALLTCWLPIAYAGILSCGVGYTLQIIGQKYTTPTVASLLMSLESVFAVVFGGLLLHEQLSPREWIGCVLMLAAIILAQLPTRRKSAA